MRRCFYTTTNMKPFYVGTKPQKLKMPEMCAAAGCDGVKTESIMRKCESYKPILLEFEVKPSPETGRHTVYPKIWPLNIPPLKKTEEKSA